jgi:hypothetical protein
MAEKLVSVFNTSKMGRRYDVPSGVEGKTLSLLPNQATEVPESVAAWLLGKKANGQPRYHDLIDASKFSPETTKAKDAALAENAKLIKENEDLKKQLAEASAGKTKKDGGK